MDREPDSDEPRELPIELMGPTPRRVRMTGTGWQACFMALFFTFLGVAFGVAIVRLLKHEAATQEELRLHGGETMGQVTDKGTRGSELYVSYTFAVDGITFSSREVKTPVAIWDSLLKGDSLRIRYLPDNPKINHPAAWEDSTTSDLWTLLFAAWLPPFGLLFVWRLPRQRRLAMEGIAVYATVTEREWKGASRQIMVDYTFRNATNDEAEIGSCPSDCHRKAGSKVCVLYLPTNPSRSEIYPFEFFQISQRNL